jgi:hypothetical protein
MPKVVYAIHFARIGVIVAVLTNCMHTAFWLAIGCVVVAGDHLELTLKVLHKLLPEVQGELTVKVGDNKEGVLVMRTRTWRPWHIGSIC